MAETVPGLTPPCHCGRPQLPRRRFIFPQCSGCSESVGSCNCKPLEGVPACSCGRALYPDENNRPRCLKCNNLVAVGCSCLPLDPDPSTPEVSNGQG